jgi:hypothetical protein
MADRRFNQFALALEDAVVNLFVKVAIGATGAPTLNVNQSLGIKSIVRNSTGNYTITFQDKYLRLLMLCPTIILATGVPATASNVQMVVRSEALTNANPTIVIEFLSNAGTAVELVSGVTLLLHARLKNSTV